MKQIKNIIRHPLFTGSFVMLLGVNAANSLAYVYHLLFGRILGPSLYGELAAIMSLIGFLTSLVSFFSAVIVKFVSVGDKNGRQQLFNWIVRLIRKLALAVLVVLILISPYLSRTFATSIFSAMQIGPIMYFIFFVMVYSSFLQGLLKFKQLIVVNLSVWLTRIVLGYLLYKLGFSLPGVVLGILIAGLVSSELGRRFTGFKIKDIKKAVYSKKREFMKYSLPVLVMTVTTGSFVTLDVMFARYFLSAHDSGLYAALATMGKIVVYMVTPIVSVMFPLVSKGHAAGKSTRNLLLWGGLGTILISSAIILIYTLLPDLAVGTLYGSKYLVITPYLARAGILNAIYALDLLVVNYYLSRTETMAAYIATIAVISQVAGIALLHGTIIQIINVSTFSALLLLTALGIYSVAKMRK